MGQPRRSVPQNVPRLVARLASPVIAALFDLDGTLLPDTSAEREFIRFALHTGQQTAPEAVRTFLSWVVHIPTRGVRSNKTYFGNVEMDLLAETAETFCRQQLTRRIPDQAQRLIAAHRTAGDCLGIVSGAPEILIAPLRDLLDLDFVVGTKLTCEQGRLTGDLDGPRVSGREKVRQADQAARTYEFDLRESTAYGNAFDDRFLLAAVARPVVVNPDIWLARLAHQKGWPICVFS
ncbi:MAG: HAD-IB family hydrolase [Gemmatimonadetes bacterium]|nr:HAD-IB family hydrolase [Gemmatimonadota bacterium]MYC71477.1 HAD-IB family hydrolase [Gemmatimonadota bacterium]MYI62917.1 HAD-IB family hydrolase [Gemmatimonadota bacterium]